MSGRSENFKLAGKIDKSRANKLTKQTISSLNRENPTPSSNGVLVFDNHGTTVEVTVKTKGKGQIESTAESLSDVKPISMNVQAGEKKRSSSMTERNNWGRILREQNQSTVEQSLHKLLDRTVKTKKVNPSENRESKKSDCKRTAKHNLQNDELDEIPRQSGSKKLSTNMRFPVVNIPSNMNSTESIIVVDKAVQCGGIFSRSNNSFGLLNPVRALGVLLKELEGLIDDERTSKIVSQMEQALFRIPVEQGQLSPADLQAIAEKAKLEATTAKLAATSKTMEESYKAVRKEHSILQKHVQDLSALVNQGKQRENHLEAEIKRLTMQLNEATKFDLVNRQLIDDLREENKQSFQNELKEMEELARQRHLELQCLKLEKEKMTIINSYKDSQLIELRNAIKDLQQNIANQLVSFQGFPEDLEIQGDREEYQSIRQKGIACSSPTPTSSNNSVGPLSWHDVSDISDSFANGPRDQKQSHPKKHSTLIPTTHILDESDGAKFQEKTHLEFVSLDCEELLPPLNSVINLNGSESKHTELKNSNKCEDRKHRERNRSHPRSKQNVELDESPSPGENTLIAPENNRYHRSNLTSGTSKDKKIKEDIQTMFDNVRSIKVPSPPRRFPRPDWSDSSLPTFSMSESNIV